MSEQELVISGCPTPPTLTICDQGKELVRIHSDGTLIYGPDYTPDAAGRVFWEALAHLHPARPLAELVRALVAKLDEVQPAIDSAFLMAQMHGSKYSGPTYGVELQAVKDALK